MSFQVRTVDGIDQIGARQWKQLETSGNPFLEREFLLALEETGSVGSQNGWRPHHVCLFEGKLLLGLVPGYIKSHSRGEFVFDWAWADGYHRAGLAYYPKFLSAVPWTPVTGPRLLVARDHPDQQGLRKALVAAAVAQCEQSGLSSWHCNFVTPPDLEALRQNDLLVRRDYQFHWLNRDYSDFDEFLASLKSKKRKNIRQERRQVQKAGIRFEQRSGADLSDDEILFLHQCYRRTFHTYGNHPALTPECFRRIARRMPDQVLAFIAFEGSEPLAMSFFLVGGDAIFGRYWGTLRDLPGLHFETAYYQGIEYCIEHGIARFESGAQGEHKIARGFEPVATYSAHHIEHAGFQEAIADYLRHESDWLENYRSDIDQHVPYRIEKQA